MWALYSISHLSFWVYLPSGTFYTIGSTRHKKQASSAALLAMPQSYSIRKEVSDLRTKLWSIKTACRLFRLYLRHPYRLYDTDQFDNFNHQHTCLLARISPTHFESLCPMAERGRFIAGDFDECENCRYFGLIHYGIDSETGDKRIEVTMGQNWTIYVDLHKKSVVTEWLRPFVKLPSKLTWS